MSVKAYEVKVFEDESDSSFSVLAMSPEVRRVISTYWYESSDQSSRDEALHLAQDQASSFMQSLMVKH